MKSSLLIFGTKNFNNSLNEIKEYLNFPLIFFDKNNFSELSFTSINSLLVDIEICSDINILSCISEIKNKPLLLIKKPNSTISTDFFCDDTAMLPLSLIEISNKISNLIIVKKFNQNSSIKIKEYEIDKNERKLKQGNISIVLTEKEIQLIELLFNEKQPLSKNDILTKVWKYADNTDTHTVETHIYRLRKKILQKFKDNFFIISSNLGYTI